MVTVSLNEENKLIMQAVIWDVILLFLVLKEIAEIKIGTRGVLSLTPLSEYMSFR